MDTLVFILVVWTMPASLCAIAFSKPMPAVLTAVGVCTLLSVLYVWWLQGMAPCSERWHSWPARAC